MKKNEPAILLNLKDLLSFKDSVFHDTCRDLNVSNFGLNCSFDRNSQDLIRNYFKSPTSLKIDNIIWDIHISKHNTIELKKDIELLRSSIEQTHQSNAHLNIRVVNRPSNKNKKDDIRYQMDSVIECLESVKLPQKTVSINFQKYSPYENSIIINDAKKTHSMGLLFEPDWWEQNRWELFKNENLWVFIAQTVLLRNLGEIHDFSLNPFTQVTPYVGVLDALQGNKSTPLYLIDLDLKTYESLSLALHFWQSNLSK